MKKRPRSRQEQTVTVARVAAAIQLQAHRPQVHESPKTYNRSKQKRLWQKDQEALHVYIGLPETPHPSSDRAAA